MGRQPLHTHIKRGMRHNEKSQETRKANYARKVSEI